MTEAQLISLISQFRKETEDLISAFTYRHYFNDGQVWANTTEVTNTIASGDREAYKLINIAGVLHWFKPDLTTLEPVFGSLDVDVDSGTVFYRKTAGSGPPEVQTLATLRADLNIPDSTTIESYLLTKVDKEDGKSLVLNSLVLKIHDKFADDEEAVIADIQAFLYALVLTEENYTTVEKNKLAGLHQDVYQLTLVSSASVSGRLSGLVEGTNYPAGWILAASSGTDLLITHNLTGQKLASVNVFEVDGANERLAIPFNTAFAGVVCNGSTVLIEGLDVEQVALRIELIFD